MAIVRLTPRHPGYRFAGIQGVVRVSSFSQVGRASGAGRLANHIRADVVLDSARLEIGREPALANDLAIAVGHLAQEADREPI